ncbi:hypothetical protein B9Q01_09920 [Candidatus Marsarchaeota G1 archaeon OSP_D]|jgi:hypothetical protein|uniref:Uncharacterized protein n=1 Tax=Candidatus Marsarchaeota G1 archaeon OSP_D TaxID=1978155 RepID=A0A2R6A5T6_9ARCH|nr:MAG: hypothetical protein B9Q01_09920 [Candidatus Marsarchaeota G1 archaeon OSP_D]
MVICGLWSHKYAVQLKLVVAPRLPNPKRDIQHSLQKFELKVLLNAFGITDLKLKVRVLN